MIIQTLKRIKWIQDSENNNWKEITDILSDVIKLKAFQT